MIQLSLKALVTCLAMLASAVAIGGNEEFNGSCAYGLSELGIDVKTDCSIRWADPKSGKVYCFGNEEVLMSFLKSPADNVRKAQQTYAKLYAK